MGKSVTSSTIVLWLCLPLRLLKGIDLIHQYILKSFNSFKLFLLWLGLGIYILCVATKACQMTAWAHISIHFEQVTDLSWRTRSFLQLPRLYLVELCIQGNGEWCTFARATVPSGLEIDVGDGFLFVYLRVELIAIYVGVVIFKRKI